MHVIRNASATLIRLRMGKGVGEPMKILFLMVDGFDTPTSINQLIETLLCDILDAGVQVHMVSGRKGGSLPDVPETLRNRSGFTFEIVDRKGTVNKSNFIKRFCRDLSYVFKAKRAWRKVIEEVDCVIMQSTPLGALHVLAIKRRRNVPVVYNMYDIFPDNTRRVVGRVPYAFFSTLQRMLYKKCDEIVVLTDDMKSTLVNKGVPESKLRSVPNWYDEYSVKEVPQGANKFIAQYNIDTSKFVVQFAGSIGYVFDYHFVVDTAELLRDCKNVEFHMIGQGARLNEFKHEASARNLDSIHFFPWQPIEEIADVYSACSIGIIPLERDVIRCAYPSKTSLLMACGRPVLYSVEEDSAFSQTIEREKTGWCVPRGDAERAARVIRRLANHPEEVSAYASRAKQYAASNLSRADNTRRFVDIIKEVCRI